MLIKGLMMRFRWPLAIVGVAIVVVLALCAGGVISVPVTTVAPATKEPVSGYTEAPYVYPDDEAMMFFASIISQFMDDHFLDDGNRKTMGYIQYGDLLLAQVRGTCKAKGEVEIWVIALRYEHESGEWDVENVVLVTTMAEFMVHYEQFQQRVEEEGQ